MTDQPTISQAELDARTRVWQHALHEEKIYNERSNFSLVAEAMLFVFFATLGVETQTWALILLSILGLILTVMWVMIAMRQEEDLKLAVERLKKYCDEYEEFEKQRKERKRFRGSGTLILGRLIPIVLGLAWVILIAEIATKRVW